MADAPDQPVYLLTGSDRPKIDTALARLRRHFAPEAIEIVTALVSSGEAAVALCNAGSLFGDARLVIVEAVDGARDGAHRPRGRRAAARARGTPGWGAGGRQPTSRRSRRISPARALGPCSRSSART